MMGKHVTQFLDVFSCKGESLGQGSFTRIFKGYKSDIRDGEKQMTSVFLKELDAVHKDYWEVCVCSLKCTWLCYIVYELLRIKMTHFVIFFHLSVILWSCQLNESDFPQTPSACVRRQCLWSKKWVQFYAVNLLFDLCPVPHICNQLILKIIRHYVIFIMSIFPH